MEPSLPPPRHFPNFYLEAMDCSRRLIIYSFLLESVEYIYISFENVIYKLFHALLKLNRDIFLEWNGSKSKFTISSRISINKPSLETKSNKNKLKVIANSSSNPFTSPPTSFETGARHVAPPIHPRFFFSPTTCCRESRVTDDFESIRRPLDNGSMSVNSRLRTRGPCTADLFEER